MSLEDIGREFIEHYGTKGMKWGVRRGSDGVRPIARTLNSSKFGKAAIKNAERHGQKADKKVAKKKAKADKKWQKNIYTTKSAIDIHNRTADYVNPKMAAFNAAHPKADIMKDTPETRAYLKAYSTMVTNGMRRAVKDVHGASPSGNLRAKLDTSDPNQFKIVVVSNKVQHADDEVEDLVFELIVSDGKISEMLLVQDEVAQGAMIAGDILEHYGVKGMRWGVRKKSSGSSSSSMSDDAKRHAANRKKGSSALSDKELKDLANRLNTEQQVARLTGNGESTAKRILAGVGTANAAIAALKSPAGQAALAVGAAAAVRLVRTSGAVSTIGKFG